MKKLREIKNRSKAKIKRIFDSDEQSSRPSTPTPPSNPGETVPPTDRTTPPGPSTCAPSVEASNTAPGVDQVPSHTPSIHTSALASNLSSAPEHHREVSQSLVVEQGPTTSPSALTQPQAPARPASRTSGLEMAPSAAKTSGRDKASPSAGTGLWSEAKSEAWAGFKSFLDTINQAASISGLGPIRNVAEGFADCIEIFEDVGQNRNGYDELRLQLESIFGELNQYVLACPTITISIQSICGSIRNELEYVKAQHARTIGRRLATAETDAENVMQCYQRIQDHLQRLSRNANISTWVVVDQLATDTRIRALAPSLWACYNSEKATELKRGPCTEGTRINVLLQMREWATSPNTQGVYWMNGMAGTGKTTIAYSLCQQLDTKDNQLLCASFFCSRSLPECRNVGRIIPSIAYQIARCSQPFRYALSKAMEEDPDAHTLSVHLQFESLILKPLLDIKVKDAFPKHMLVVIDALDECEDVTSTQQMLQVLLTRSKDLPIKFVVSSRPEASIRHQMEKNGTWVNSRMVLHELDSGEVQTDIKRYLETELAQIKVAENEVHQLAERAGVLFIYAATVIRYVGYDNFGRNPRARLDAVLGVAHQKGYAQTKEIDQLYGSILEAATSDEHLNESEQDDMKLVLNTVVCARTPLTANALNGLLQLGDVERVNAALRPLWSVLHVKGQDMPVTILHASFPDYLTDPKRSGNSTWHCDPAVVNDVLAQLCFECIRDARPQFNICRLESSYITDNEVQDLDLRVKKLIPVELRYACRYWSVHLCASEPSAPLALIMCLERFLTKNLLLWMEVMNLTRDMSVRPSELTNVSGWATRHGTSQDLIRLIQDAWRFATTIVSSPVGQSTPHIYVSMLPFLPSHSPIRKHYGHRMHGMVGVEGTARDRRKGRLGGWISKPSNCAAFSSDCNLLAIVPGDCPSVISLVDASSGCLVRDMTHENVGSILCLAFSSDGSRVASGTGDNSIWVWDDSGQLVLGPLTGHSRPILSIVYSHNGAFIISGSDDCTIRVWDAKFGNLAIPPLRGHTSGILCISISPDDTKIISGSHDETVRVWDMQSGCLVFDPITEHTGSIRSIAVSPNGKLIATGSDDRSVGIWDIQTGQAVAGPFSLTDWATSLVISPDSLYISVGIYNGIIQIWDVLTGQAASEQLQAHSAYTAMLAYSPDGTRIISYSNHDGSLCVFDAHDVTATGDTLPAHPESILSIDISPDGKYILSGSDRHSLRIWDLMSGELVHGPLTGHTNRVDFVHYSADGHRILSCSTDGTLLQWDAQTGDAVQIDSPITAQSITRDSSDLYFDCATYSPDGGYIATASSNSDVCIWCSSSGEMVVGPMDSSIIGRQHALAIIFSEDGMTVITGWNDGTVDMWNAKTSKLVSSNLSHFGSVSAFAFSADGLNNVIAGYSGHRTMHQQITRTGDPTGGPFRGHTDNVSTAQYSPDGTRIVSGSHDKTVHIWDTQSATSIFGPLEGHSDWVRSVAYSPDGTFVASASDDTTICIWDAITQPDSPQARIITFYQINPCSPKPAAPKMGPK